MILSLEKHPNRWIKPRFNQGHWMDDHWRCWRRTWFGLSNHAKGRGKKLPKKQRFSIVQYYFLNLLPFVNVSLIYRWNFAKILRFFSPSINLHEISAIHPNIFFPKEKYTKRKEMKDHVDIRMVHQRWQWWVRPRNGDVLVELSRR